ncbi:NepR family anti-sigma factor [Sphingomicrobium sediminis]|uniref:Anti-sigma factor NepR domain-containing protein n=1 Tax=Sphingomicrobium sediminis TaxID=2950949 RepID=A0A9X2J2Z1_9SPHN|nr:NepR family anti-sigma factor [Sphingomicrobium sediminis]MCM8557545.1 hypothetical protein [Sphingomicrobium sediminis]
MSGKKDSGTADAKSGAARRTTTARPKSEQVSRALKSVYDDTLREDIPAELRDLLGKLD